MKKKPYALTVKPVVVGMDFASCFVSLSNCERDFGALDSIGLVWLECIKR